MKHLKSCDCHTYKNPSLKRHLFSGNILLYKSEPKVRRVAAIEAAEVAEKKEEGGGLAKRDTPQETNRASSAASLATTTQKGKQKHHFTSPINVGRKTILEQSIH